MDLKELPIASLVDKAGTSIFSWKNGIEKASGSLYFMYFLVSLLQLNIYKT